MSEWIKANGGPIGAIVVGLGLAFAFWPLGAAVALLGVLLWLNESPRFPWKVVRESNLVPEIEDVAVAQVTNGEFVVQLTAAVRNGGGSTTLHSWGLDFQVQGETVPGIAQANAQALLHPRAGIVGGPPQIGSLADKTRLVPLGRGTERGLLAFRMPTLTEEKMLAMERDGGMLILSVADQNDRRWQTSISYAELAARGGRGHHDPTEPVGEGIA